MRMENEGMNRTLSTSVRRPIVALQQLESITATWISCTTTRREELALSHPIELVELSASGTAAAHCWYPRLSEERLSSSKYN